MSYQQKSDTLLKKLNLLIICVDFVLCYFISRVATKKLVELLKERLKWTKKFPKK